MVQGYTSRVLVLLTYQLLIPLLNYIMFFMFPLFLRICLPLPNLLKITAVTWSFTHLTFLSRTWSPRPCYTESKLAMVSISLCLQGCSRFCQASSSPHLSVWHNRFGHPETDVVRQIMSSLQLSFRPPTFCTSCPLAKSRRLPFASSTSWSTHPLQLLLMDVWGLPLFYLMKDFVSLS